MRDAQIAELLKHGVLTLTTDGDGTRHDPTEEPHPYLHEVEVREVLLHAFNTIFVPPEVLAISGHAPQAAHGLAPLAAPSKKKKNCRMRPRFAGRKPHEAPDTKNCSAFRGSTP